MFKSKLYFQLKKLKRSFLIWKTLFLLLIGLWFDNFIFKFFLKSSVQKNNFQEKREKWCTKELIQLCSAFIKIGQLLSARPDLIPKTWIKELTTLQDAVPPFSFTKVTQIIKEELNNKYENIHQIDSLPIGSASLAQVHKATLKNGNEAVSYTHLTLPTIE